MERELRFHKVVFWPLHTVVASMSTNTHHAHTINFLKTNKKKEHWISICWMKTAQEENNPGVHLLVITRFSTNTNLTTKNMEQCMWLESYQWLKGKKKFHPREREFHYSSITTINLYSVRKILTYSIKHLLYPAVLNVIKQQDKQQKQLLL